MEEDKNQIFKSWADNLIARIIKGMKVQGIDPDNPDYSGESYLQKSLDYKIHNAAGGDAEKISFFYAYYGLFVEMGVQGGQPYSQEKLSSPYKEGSKYASKQPGVRPPKPFLFVLANQRVFSLQKIVERVVTENVTISIMSSLSVPDKKDQVKRARGGFWDKYLRAKGRI